MGKSRVGANIKLDAVRAPVTGFGQLFRYVLATQPGLALNSRCSCLSLVSGLDYRYVPPCLAHCGLLQLDRGSNMNWTQLCQSKKLDTSRLACRGPVMPEATWCAHRPYLKEDRILASLLHHLWWCGWICPRSCQPHPVPQAWE
jgi:hypothetical protein